MPPPKKKEEEKDIKLFDFSAESDIKESNVSENLKGDGLEEPKLYLNVCYSDAVLPPLSKDKKIADLKVTYL